MADKWARDLTNDIDWDAFMDSDAWADLPDGGVDVQSADVAAEAPALLPYGGLVWEDLHSPDNYVGIGLEDTGNTEISKSMSYAESLPRNRDSDISHPKAGIERTVNDRSQDFWFPNPAKCCSCITCQELGVYGRPLIINEVQKACGIKGCKTAFWANAPNHERNHFKTPGGYACAEQGCHFVNKKFTDLQRHYTSKHCTNPNAKNLECPEIGCEYRTARKDKLKEHQKCKHKGKPKLGKPYRVIKPAISSKPVSGTSGVTATE